MSKVLFLCKQSDYNWSRGSPQMATGLRNSASMCCEVLNAAGIDAKLVVVIDNNDIDREVTAYRPTHVIIEALWVVPSKFDVLIKLHPAVHWIVRFHSELPFLAGESPAAEWMIDYSKFLNVRLSGNSPNLQEAIIAILEAANPGRPTKHKVVYLPNCYVAPEPQPQLRPRGTSEEINVGCFGAIRPLKNQFLQAVSAIEFAEQERKKLVFHMNEVRIEERGEPILRNIKVLFEKQKRHRLVLHPWLNRDDFLRLVGEMDLGMQVSLSESFNIVSADFAWMGVPTVVSPEVYWMPTVLKANATNLGSIVETMRFAIGRPRLSVWMARGRLKSRSNSSKVRWIDYFSGRA